MTLEQLRIFLAVAERRHVTRASIALNLSQSAVSASIAALQERHGVKLFERVGRRIKLTDAGERFLKEAHAVMSRAETAELFLEDLAQETRGRLRIYASQTVASYWLPARLVRLHDANPGIELCLTVGNTAQVAGAVTEGSADIGLIEGEIVQRGLEVQIVAHDELVMVVAPHHPLAKHSRVALTTCPKQSWILREPGSGTRSEFAKYLERAGYSLADLNVVMELPSNEAALAAVAAGNHVSVLSRRAAEGASASGRVHLLRIGEMKRVFSVLIHPDRHRTRSVAAMLQILSNPHSGDVSNVTGKQAPQ
ncbi:MAG: LysR family transcriptional regulator [Rhizobiaceae bacterium]